LATASAQVCVPLGHSSLYFTLRRWLHEHWSHSHLSVDYALHVAGVLVGIVNSAGDID